MKSQIRFLTLLGFSLATLPSFAVAMAADATATQKAAAPSGTLKPTAAPRDPFAENVRTTPWLKPEQEQKSFHLPPGFEIQLVAAEPDINKPMNLAFDASGRLWVTTSREYPFPVPLDKPARDRIMIFEDFGPDGRARKVTTFAEGLNIPIGLYPFRSASSSATSSGKIPRGSVGPRDDRPTPNPSQEANGVTGRRAQLPSLGGVGGGYRGERTNESAAAPRPRPGETWKCIAW